jgi:hypothetical protein
MSGRPEGPRPHPRIRDWLAAAEAEARRVLSERGYDDQQIAAELTRKNRDDLYDWLVDLGRPADDPDHADDG